MAGGLSGRGLFGKIGQKRSGFFDQVKLKKRMKYQESSKIIKTNIKRLPMAGFARRR